MPSSFNSLAEKLLIDSQRLGGAKMGQTSSITTSLDHRARFGRHDTVYLTCSKKLTDSQLRDRSLHACCRRSAMFCFVVYVRHALNTVACARGNVIEKRIFLPRDGMHKSGLCRRAVSVCLSVRPSVTFVPFSRNEQTYLQNVFTISSHAIWFFHTKRYAWQYSDGNPLNVAKIAIFDQYLALASITAGPSRVVNISTVEHRLYHLNVVRLPLSTNVAVPCIIGECCL